MARHSAPSGPTPPFRLRVRALLAAALVLGIGSALTLAAWTDRENAAGRFGAGTFGIVGSTDGSTFAEHPTDPTAATLAFTPGGAAASALTPGRTVYAAFSVRTTADSVAGTVLLSAAPGNGAGLGAWLRYGVKTVPTPACDAASYSASTAVQIAAGSPLTAGGTATSVLPAGGAGSVNYCFEFTLPSTAPDEAQGATLGGRWSVDATSS